MGAITFATWNVNWMSRSDKARGRKLDYLAARDWDVLALQEATPDNPGVGHRNRVLLPR